MNTPIDKTLEKFRAHIAGDLPELYKAYDDLVRLHSQLLGVIHDKEGFGSAYAGAAGGKTLADSRSEGTVHGSSVTLTIHEPLPATKELTGAVQDHWLNLMQAAIGKAREGGQCLYHGKAFVWIEIETPRGSDNAKLWDTSNRAVNLVINNLKGVFFKDDNHEHMAFGVVGRRGKEGATIIHVLPFDRIAHITDASP